MGRRGAQMVDNGIEKLCLIGGGDSENMGIPLAGSFRGLQPRSERHAGKLWWSTRRRSSL